jgi:hypothetical protein
VAPAYSDRIGYQNVVGLPRGDLDELLSEVGHRLVDWVSS